MSACPSGDTDCTVDCGRCKGGLPLTAEQRERYGRSLTALSCMRRSGESAATLRKRDAENGPSRVLACHVSAVACHGPAVAPCCQAPEPVGVRRRRGAVHVDTYECEACGARDLKLAQVHAALGLACSRP